MNDRHIKILNLIEENQNVTLQELIKACNVSEATIRRDLTSLEDKNLIFRTHGGASKRIISRGVESSVDAKRIEFVIEKKRVASYLCKNIVKSGQTIYLDAGTTTYEMINYLKEKHVTVVTNSIYNLEKLIQNKIHTIILGGTVKHSTQAIIGHTAIEQLENYSFDICFLGCNGIDHEFGISTADESEAYIKSHALKNSKVKYILTDNSKFGHRKFQKFAELDEVQIVSYDVPKEFKKYDNIIDIKEEDN